ncbi:argonaute 4-like protein [Tanacetum coccineum]
MAHYNARAILLVNIISAQIRCRFDIGLSVFYWADSPGPSPSPLYLARVRVNLDKDEITWRGKLAKLAATSDPRYLGEVTLPELRLQPRTVFGFAFISADPEPYRYQRAGPVIIDPGLYSLKNHMYFGSLSKGLKEYAYQLPKSSSQESHSNEQGRRKLAEYDYLNYLNGKGRQIPTVHRVIREDGINLLTVIKDKTKYRQSWKHDFVKDYFPPSMSEYKSALEGNGCEQLNYILKNAPRKLGGLNSMLTVEHSPSFPVVSKAPTIILRMDVSHGFPSQSDVPSIAAVVSSRHYPLISRYRAPVRTQSPKVEMIDSLFKKVSDTEGWAYERVTLDFYVSQRNHRRFIPHFLFKIDHLHEFSYTVLWSCFCYGRMLMNCPCRPLPVVSPVIMSVLSRLMLLKNSIVPLTLYSWQETYAHHGRKKQEEKIREDAQRNAIRVNNYDAEPLLKSCGISISSEVLHASGRPSSASPEVESGEWSSPETEDGILITRIVSLLRPAKTPCPQGVPLKS